MTEPKKRILVTGGAGFIGSYLCEKYLGEGHEVICIDNLQTTGDTANIAHLIKNPRFTFMKHDIIEPFLPQKKVDWIFNFGCSGAPARYQFDPVHTLKTNIMGMLNALELARRDGARIMQASTSEVYGNPDVDPQPETYLGRVNTIGPRSCYDEGKRAAETLCMDYQRQYGLDVKIIRIFNTFGPRMDANDGRALTNFVVEALDNAPITMYGDGSMRRSFQYIDDLVEGIDRMMKKDGFIGPVNLGNPEAEMSMKELAETIVRMAGSESEISYGPPVADDPQMRRPDIALAEKKLGWKPHVPFEEGLQKTIDYFREAPRPAKKALVFATTYYPTMGPAEEALFALTQKMPDTEFHIVTTRFKRGLSRNETHGGNNHIYRVGFGMRADKFLLPILGFFTALKLERKHEFSFVWSVMASYGAIAPALLRLFHPKMNFLITLDPEEVSAHRSYLSPFYRLMFSGADSVYVSDPEQEARASLMTRAPERLLRADRANFVDQVRYTYASLLNKKSGKLDRPR